MSASRAFADLLGIEHPILQGPMAGGPSTPALVAAVSRAGGLGNFGAAYMTPAQIVDDAARVRQITDKPFGINLFAGGIGENAGFDPAPMLALMARHHAALGLPPPELPAWPADPFAAQLDAVLEAKPAVFSFTFGIPPAAQLARVRAQGIRIVGTATTVEEARRLVDAGVDAVVALGSEAGGHRGTFVGSFESSMIGGIALIPQVADAVGTSVPVIASGGIMDGRGIAAALALGASAAQLGTAFLRTHESGAPAAHKARLAVATEDQIATTIAFSGRPARGIRNAFMDDVAAAGDIALPFPLQNALTRPMRIAAGKAGDAERLSLWAGQGVRLGRAMTAAALMEALIDETAAAIQSLSSR